MGEIDLLERSETLVGEFIEVTPVSIVSNNVVGGNTKYQCELHPEFPNDWQIYLLAPESENIQLDEPIRGWVFTENSNKKKLEVTRDDFGRADLHNQRGKFRRTANYIADLPNLTDPSPDDIKLEYLSEGKGLATRCLKKDRPNWYTVYHLFGKPPLGELNQIQSVLSQLRDAADSGNKGEVQQRIAELRDRKLAARYALFLRRLNLHHEFEAISDEWLLKKLQQMEPSEFEKFIADCWEERQFETEVVNQPNDYGADIKTRRDRFTPYLQNIQVKQKNPDSKPIPQNRVQRYRGGLEDLYNADASLFITTGSFHWRAEEWAENIDSYALIDGHELVEFLREENLLHVAAEYVDLK